MQALRRALGGLAALLRRRRTDADLEDELRAFLDASADEKIRAGMTRSDAVRAARLEMGSLDAVKDYTRDAGWETAVESLWRDAIYAGRRLRKARVFTAVAIGTLALGIGANTTIFSIVNAVMLRPLPVDRPEELVALAVSRPDGVESIVSYAAYQRFAADAAEAVDVLAASTAGRDAIAIDGPPEPVFRKWVSGSYFRVLRQAPSLGRLLEPDDDRVGAARSVAVLSDAYWTRRFGRDPSVVGKTLRLRAAAFTIVGVAPRGFTGETIGEVADVWMPMTAQPGAPPFLWHGHSTTWLSIVARRKPGVTFDQAKAALTGVYDRIRLQIAAESSAADAERTLASRLVVANARSGPDRLRGRLSTPLLVLMGIVGLVLLAACANIANLMTARAAARRRETAVCLAIGAGRGRLVRQALAEALIIGAVGGMAGFALAMWGGPLLIGAFAGAVGFTIDASPDVRVLAFTALLSGVTALVFGVLPASRMGRVDPIAAMKTGDRAGRSAARLPLGRTLVVAQVAVSLVLLVAAGLFVRSLRNLREIDPGFDPDRVLVLTTVLTDRSIPLDERRALERQLLAAAESVPGVQAASASSAGVFGRGTWGNAIAVEGLAPQPGSAPRTLANAVTHRFFEVMRLAVLRGRGLSSRDDAAAPKVAVVNETFARRFFAGADPIGRHVGLCRAERCALANTEPLEVVGVVEDARFSTLRENRQAMLYLSAGQHGQALREIEIRSIGAPAAVAAAVHRALERTDGRIAVVEMAALQDRVDATIVGEMLVAKMSAGFGLLALFLAALGVYGVVAYVTNERAGEIGIRMALGADRISVRRLVLRDTMMLVLAGSVVGVPAALAGARLVAAQLYQVTPGDPVAIASGLAVLTVAALAAGYIPAWRASRLDPLKAIRAD